jgi:hypothetical protein
VAKKNILKQSTSTRTGDKKMKEQIKSWKAERYRRQKIRDFKKSQKEIAKDLSIWYDRMKAAALQVANYQTILNNRKQPYESTSNKS